MEINRGKEKGSESGPQTPRPRRKDPSSAPSEQAAREPVTLGKPARKVERPGAEDRPDFGPLLIKALRMDPGGINGGGLRSPGDVTTECEDNCLLCWPDEGEPYAVALTRVDGVAKPPLAVPREPSPRPPFAQVLSGVYPHGVSVLSLLLGQGASIQLYVGTKASGGAASVVVQAAREAFDSLRTCLLATYAGIRLTDLQERGDYEVVLRQLAAMDFAASLGGNPSRSIGQDHEASPVDKVVRALAGSRYAYIIEAMPIETAAVLRAFKDITARIVDVHKSTKWTASRSTSGVTQESLEQVDRFAEHYERLLEVACEKLDAGLREGMWCTRGGVLAANRAALERTGSLVRAIFSGPDAKPEPFRLHIHQSAVVAQALKTLRACRAPGTVADVSGLVEDAFETPLCSSDLGLLMELPRSESAGYRVSRSKDFALDVLREPGAPVSLGRVVGPTGPSPGVLHVELKELTRHTLIAGVTGSGKTNTALHMLTEIWSKHGIPFLVIEPAKAQYRQLLSCGLDLQIFAPGLRDVAPLRLNPFEFPAGIDPQAHIAGLYATFNAAFILYAPMPYVLERSLYEVYEERGWDFGAGRHPDADPEGHVPSLAYPTLTDLHAKIGEVVDRLGYDQRIRMDVTAGLQARVDSLRVGQKGQTFDTQVSVPFDALLAKPTILELSHIGNDDEKAFLMGLIMTCLYEHLQEQGESQTLQHLTLVEEAHRLLSRAASDTSAAEVANVKGKAVEAFCNMLAEIRAYGEGLIVAEQIPSKLAEDLIKNTNLKIMHRIVASDDRDLMGGAMNLLGLQKRAVTSLTPGQAVVYGEGMESPALVQVPKFETPATTSDADVRQASAAFYREYPDALRPLPGCAACRQVCWYGARAKRWVRDTGRLIAVWGFLVTAATDPKAAVMAWARLRDILLPQEEARRLRSDQRDDFAWCLLTILAEKACWQLRAVQRVPVGDLERLLEHFRRIAEHARRRDPRPAFAALAQDARALGEILRSGSGPCRGCIRCPSPCLCGPLGKMLAQEGETLRGFSRALDASEPGEAMRRFCRDVSEGVLFTGKQETVHTLAICLFAHTAERIQAANPARKIDLVFGASSE